MKKSRSPSADALRQRAEEKLRERKALAAPALSEADARALVHELQVHQIELEMQNEELQRAQVAAQEAADRFADLFDFAPVGYFVLDPHGAVRAVNLAGAALLGLDRQRVAGQPFEPYVVPDSRVEFGEFLVRVLASEPRLSCEVRLLRHGQGPCDVFIEGTVAEARPGAAQDCRLAVRDISEVKKAQAAIHEANATLERRVSERTAELQSNLERFYAVLSSMYSGVLLVTDEGRVEFANRAFCDRFGLKDTPAELAGLGSRDMIEKIKGAYLHPDEAVARIREILERGKPVQGEEVAMQGGGTCLRDFVPLNIQGQSRGRLWIHVDITERKQAEEDVRNASTAALNLMEDAVEARQTAERVSAELRVANEDLTRFNRAAVDRELRMIELKKQVNELRARAGLPAEYTIEGEKNGH